MSLTSCRVVLVRTEIAANIGATARVMRNFGLNQLVLVAPVADSADREARRLSTHGEAILESARIVPTLDDALAPCLFAAATSARTGGLIRETGDVWPETIMPRLLAALADGPAALVFGPEPSGLTNEEVTRCDALIHIPAADDYPALNLAQAVAIFLYELRRMYLKTLTMPSAEEPPATDADRERMFAHLRTALERIHFLYGDKTDALMHAVRRLIGRAAPTAQEIKLLHGMARQMEWIAGQGGPEARESR